MRTQAIFGLAAIGAIGLFVVIGCNNNSSRATRDMDVVKNAESQYEPSQTPTQTDVTKMEREAEMRFRVKDVIQATGVLEKMASQHGGYVAKSMYDIEESETLIKKVSTDSAQEIRKLDQKNHLEVFVLNTKLDSFLEKVKPLVDHLNYRHLSANDLTPSSTSQTAATGSSSVTYADRSYTASSADSSSVGNQFAKTKQNVRVVKTRFARVIMDIYQTPVVKKWIIPNPDSFDVARGGFWDDFVSSVRTGGRGLMLFFNYVISFWPLILLAIGVWIFIRRRRGLSLVPAFFRLIRRKSPTGN